MTLLALALTIWTAWRWLGFVAGLGRLQQFKGVTRREARRTVVNRGAINIFMSIAAIYFWALGLELILAEAFVGFLAATMMCSLAIGVAAAFMQPERRTPETLDVCRVIPRR